MRKTIIAMAAAVLLAACGGNGGNVGTDTNTEASAPQAKLEVKAKTIWKQFLKEGHEADTAQYLIKTKDNVESTFLYRAIRKEDITSTEYNKLYKLVCYPNNGFTTVAFLEAKSMDGEEYSYLTFYKYQDEKLTKDFSVIDQKPDFLEWNEEGQYFSNLSGEVYLDSDEISIKHGAYFQADDDDRDQYESTYRWTGKRFEK